MKQQKTLPSGRKSRLRSRENLHAWVFLAPFLAGVLFIYIGVIVDSLRFSFSDMTMSPTGYVLQPIGLENYRQALFVDPNFVRTVVTSIGSFVVEVPVIIIFSLCIATQLNQRVPGRGIFRAIFFVPVILAVGFVAKAEVGNSVMEGYQQMEGVKTGLAAQSSIFSLESIRQAVRDMGLDVKIVDFISGLVNGIYDIINRSGVQIILFLAGLQSISPSIYEAAQVEGVTGWESFWKITFPIMGPIIFVNVIYSTIDLFTGSANPVMALISGSAFSANTTYGVSSAMAWIYFAAICVLLGLIALIASRFFRDSKGKER